MIKTKIICEAGVNHNGSIEVCKDLIAIAALAGADIVKFQAYKAEKLSSRDAVNANYVLKGNKGQQETHLSMLARLELTQQMKRDIVDFVNKKDIELLYSIFDIDSLHEVLNDQPKIIKIPSGEIDNIPLLREIGKNYKHKIILSTGMSTYGDIEKCLHELTGYGNNIENITLLHCTTSYPTDFIEVNMKSMVEMGKRFGVAYGYSDHTIGCNAAIMAVSLGASCIEKHITLSQFMSGPDHQASIEPQDLIKYVKTIRDVELALGDGIKKVTESEKENLPIARKSIYTKTNIKAGQLFTEENLTTKRPGNGVSAGKWDAVIGRIAERDYHENEKIDSI